MWPTLDRSYKTSPSLKRKPLTPTVYCHAAIVTSYRGPRLAMALWGTAFLPLRRSRLWCHPTAAVHAHRIEGAPSSTPAAAPSRARRIMDQTFRDLRHLLEFFHDRRPDVRPRRMQNVVPHGGQFVALWQANAFYSLTRFAGVHNPSRPLQRAELGS